MFLANGSYNGKSYKKEPISLDELISGVKDADISAYFRKPVVEITHPESRLQLDPLNNNRIRRRQSVSIKTNYNLVDKKGNRCNVVYYESESFTDQNVPVREPRRLYVFQDEAMTTGLNMGEDKEKSVFILLSPVNEDSPFCIDSAVSTFKVYDPAKINKERVRAEYELLELHTLIQKMAKDSPDELKRKAQGIKINGDQLLGIDFDDIPTVVVSLIEMSRRNPKDFKAAFEDITGTATVGLVRDAIRKGILQYTTENMETIVMYNNTEMCRFSKNLDVAIGVLNFVVDNDIRYWQSLLSNAVADADVRTKTKKV